MAKNKKFTKTLTFRVLCIIAAILVGGLIYNFVVNIKKESEKTVEEEQAEQQAKASNDTIDIIGDYLWTTSKKNTEEVSENNQALKNAAEKAAKDEKDKAIRAARKDPIPVPAPEIGPVPVVPQSSNTNSSKPETMTKSGTPAKSSPLTDKVDAPKVEKID